MTAQAELPPGLLVSWVGDDFTGSAAVMEVLNFAGLQSVLFLDIPTAEQLNQFQDLRGIGIATTARAETPEQQSVSLPRLFEWMAALKAPIFHYKICSTLDSSPEVGNIGRAIDLACSAFQAKWIPCLVAAPPIRRYQAFGNLFAAASDGVRRLDRHPVMASHPVTPMHEADVGLHLSRQTERPIELVDAEALESARASMPNARSSSDAPVILLDTVTGAHLTRCGELFWTGRGDAPFVVGSQGVEYALIKHWRQIGILSDENERPTAGPVDRMMVVSGSASQVTADQIEWAAANGFDVIELDATAVSVGEKCAEAQVVKAALSAISQGRDPLIATVRGSDDVAIARRDEACALAGVPAGLANERIGEALGRVAAEVVETTRLKRIAVSGGDTSGHAMRQLGVYALSALAPTIPGAALLRCHASNKRYDGLQIALKGGQMGSPDYFGWIKNGGGPRPDFSKGPNE